MPRSLASVLSWFAGHAGAVSNLVLSLLVASLGWFALEWREIIWPTFGDEPVDWQELGMDPLQRLSYDLPFLVRSSLPGPLRAVAGPARSTDDVVIVYFDELSGQGREEMRGGGIARTAQTKLLERLTASHPRAVFFDFVFDKPTPDDAGFAAGLQRNGGAFIGAALTTNSELSLTTEQTARLMPGLLVEKRLKPTDVLAKSAHGWGLLTFLPIDSDYGVRRLYVGKPRPEDPWPTATWQLAQFLGANLPEDPETRFTRRWLNYYNPGSFSQKISYDRIFQADGGVDPAVFTNRIVFVGARATLGSSAKKLQDEFATPWSRFGGHVFKPGVEIHATTFMNLWRHDWITRVPLATEKWLIVLFGLALGALRWLRPWFALLAAGTAAIMIFFAACLLQWHSHLWWNWSVPVLLQIPTAGILAIGSRYYLEERHKRKLRSAFGLYVSPALANDIAERNYPLAPGGQKVVITQVFTDLEGFTTLSEKLGDSALIGKVLVEYFTRTTGEIFAQDGTVIKFIGDAVHAAWGAPLPQSDHAERAVRAAWRLAQVSTMDVPVPRPDGSIEVMHVRTRIGIHTGEALAGNLGSAKRFDYAVIGDATNFAARLEGLNKFTGTTILLSDDTARQLNGGFLLRPLGEFRLKGKQRSVVIHELLGEEPNLRPPWLDMFASALAAWKAGEVRVAGDKFRAVVEARSGLDGPSQFYLERIKASEPTPEWTGTVTINEK